MPRGRRVDPVKAINARKHWISLEYQKMAASSNVMEDDKVLYGGSYLNIMFSPGDREELIPNPAAGEVVVRSRERGRVKELVRRWFIKETSAYAVRKVSELAPLMGVRPSRVDVREIGKWGYCTRTGRLSFSLQLIALPDRLKEYVVLHELTHLLVFNHSSAFRTALSKICPDFRERERELDGIIPFTRLTLA